MEKHGSGRTFDRSQTLYEKRCKAALRGIVKFFKLSLCKEAVDRLSLFPHQPLLLQFQLKIDSFSDADLVCPNHALLPFILRFPQTWIEYVVKKEVPTDLNLLVDVVFLLAKSRGLLSIHPSNVAALFLP